MKQILLLGVKSIQKSTRFLAVDYENDIEINSDTQLNTIFEGILTSSIFFLIDIFKEYLDLSKRFCFFFSVSITVCNKYSCESGFYKYTSKKKIYISVNWTLH